MTRPEDINGSPSVVNRRPVNRNPYQPVGDFVSNVSRFKIIESTLREGEQFANAFFDTETKIKIAKALDDFGVDYIELTSPAASEQSRKDCEAICKLGLKAKILTHIRCTMEDARIAVETGVDGLDVVIGTSHFLREFSHGKDMAYITKSAIEVINFIKSKGLEVRFSSEDSFRSDLVDLLSLYRTVDRVGVNRVGIADTVGCASPRQVYDLVRTLRGVVSCDIEIHLHDDTGCAIANAYCALEAGATHIDTSVIGIGERNGITSLGGLMARMIVADREYVTKKYNLHKLKELEDLVAEAVQVNTPFNNPITGFCAFTHKAGIHAKAILNNPSTYEIINPADFGLTRYVHFASRLTGWNAVKTRVGQLGLSMTDDQVKVVTQKIKALADVRPIAIDDADSIIRTFHLSLGGETKAAGNGAVAEKMPETADEKSGEAVGGNETGDVAAAKVVETEMSTQPEGQALVEESGEAPAEISTMEADPIEALAVGDTAAKAAEIEAPKGEELVSDSQAEAPVEAAVQPAAQLPPAEGLQVEVPSESGVPGLEAPVVEDKPETPIETTTVETPVKPPTETSAREVLAPQAPVKVSPEAPIAEMPIANEASVPQPPVEASPEVLIAEIPTAEEPAEDATLGVSVVQSPVEIMVTAPEKISAIETVVPIAPVEIAAEIPGLGGPTETLTQI
ncbi:HMGL-like-domain-containing protein [Cercophora newfieldiana]|uniref:homocitrate synthase n=1 Tax=Cercophora newfieldiana TaxID=92897 RepID=A0AA39YIX5_9PEZI|nr:HMGL-like-domain-containing protein [Cercophora newfieldiana]